MRDSSKQMHEIDVVLRGLSEVETPPHLGEDVRRQISIRLREQAALDGRRRRWSSAWIPGLLSGACAALIAAVLWLHPGRTSLRGDAALPQQALVERQQRLHATTSASASPHVSAGRAGLVSPADSRGDGLQAPAVTAVAARRRRVASIPAVPVSHPAPVPPLTEQERLLVRVAQQGDPVLLAALNSELQASLDAAATNDFMKRAQGEDQ